MTLKLSSLAVTAALFSTAALPQAASAANLALISHGASFVSASSYIPLNTFGLTIDHSVMETNLLTNTPSPAISNGDARFIFDHDDANATIEINLGTLRQISSIGANATLPSYGDRFILGPFTADVSTDGVGFTPFGGSLAIDNSTTNPIALSGPVQDVQYIRYHFGVSPDYYGGGGVAVSQLFANSVAVPEPAAWALMLCGVGLAGASLRQRRALAGASATV